MSGTALLSHFQDLTDIVSIKVTSLSLILLIRREIQDVCTINSSDCEEVVALKRAVAKNLNRRLPLTDAVTLATLLDPSTKDLIELDQKSKIELLVEAVVTNMAWLPDAALVSGTSTSSPAVASSEQAAVGSDDDSSMTVQEQQGLHIDELKTVSKRQRLLLKHRVESEP